MPENQASQVFKLDDRVVSEGGCLTALFALDSYSDMGSLYHIDIVEAIADCERTLRILRLLFDQIDGTCLLPGSGSEDYHRFGLHQDILCKGFQ